MVPRFGNDALVLSRFRGWLSLRRFSSEDPLGSFAEVGTVLVSIHIELLDGFRFFKSILDDVAGHHSSSLFREKTNYFRFSIANLFEGWGDDGRIDIFRGSGFEILVTCQIDDAWLGLKACTCIDFLGDPVAPELV